MRSPRRTAQTASALMVGLALVSAIAVFGASLSRSATSSVDNAISADLIVTDAQQRAGRLQQRSGPDRGGAVPGVTASSTVYQDQFEVQGLAREPHSPSRRENLSETVILNMTEGSSSTLADGRPADRHHHGQLEPPGRRATSCR